MLGRYPCRADPQPFEAGRGKAFVGEQSHERQSEGRNGGLLGVLDRSQDRALRKLREARPTDSIRAGTPQRDLGRTGEANGAVHEGAFARNLSSSKRYEEVRVLASESPERLEQLRERFLRALSDLTSGGTEEGKPAMVSEVARGAGLDPEGDPDDRALSERLAAELVEAGYASAEAGSSGFLIITPEGERAIGGGQSPSAAG